MTNPRIICSVISLYLCCACVLQAQITRLEIRPFAAEYSKSLDSVVMLSAVPSQLSVWSTASKTMTGSVGLPATPTALALSPDGRSAAVGHDGRITIVDLEPLSIRKTFSVSCEVLSIVYGGNGWVYAFPRRDQWSTIRSIEIETGAEGTGSYYSFYAGSVGKLMPGTDSVYVAQNGLSPDHIQKFDISKGPISYLYDWQYHGDYSACGNLWASPDGRRILTRCGNVFRASPARTEDMTYNGKLPVQLYLTGADFALSKDMILAVGTSQSYYGDSNLGADRLYVFGYQNLNQIGSQSLPQFESLGRQYASYGRFVFANAAEDMWVAIVQADPASGLLNDYAVATGRLAGFVLHDATFSSSVLAPDQIGSAFASFTGIPTISSQENPAPTRLGDIEVKLVGSDGVERLGRVLSVNPAQIRFITPTDLPAGPAQVYIDNFKAVVRTILDVEIRPVAPGIYTASGDGKGAPMGVARRVPTAGDPILSYLYRRDSSNSAIVPNAVLIVSQACTPSTEKVYLDLSATGLRHASRVIAVLGSLPVPVTVSHDVTVDGRDSIVVGPLPTESLRTGTYDLSVTADGIAANTTQIQLQYK